jgi:hypothetical protein
MKQLTKIEKLDGQFPGLADDVRKWLTRGIFCREIAGLLAEKYPVSVTTGTVGSFRMRRWVPEQELLREKRIEALAAQMVASEREIKAALAAEDPGETR